MMRFFAVILLCLLFQDLQAQEQVLGLVQHQDTSLSNVHVKNVSSGRYSVSDASGNFRLSISAGDTLVLSHVGFQDLISFISEEDLQQNPLVFRMAEDSQELDEVLVGENSEINAVSLGIIPKKIKKLSVNERRLQAAGDFKPIHALGILGGGVSFDAILNAINGRTKKLKRNVAIEQRQKHIAYLEIHLLDYMKGPMELSSEQSQLLINYVLEEEKLEDLIAQGNEAQLQLFLWECWLKIQDQNE